MRLNTVIYLLLSTLFLLVSCKEASKNGDLVDQNVSLKSKYIDLDHFGWLSDYNNFQDKFYQEKYNQNLEKNLQTNNFENAAAYFIAYGIAAKQIQVYDSTYVKRVIQFLDDKGAVISGEAKTNLYHYLGTQYRNAGQLDKSSENYIKSFDFQPETATHRQAIGLSHLLLAQNYLGQRELFKTEENLVKAQEIFEEIGDRENQGKVYLLMHTLYVRNMAYDKAESILEKSIAIFEEEKSDFYAFTAHIFKIHYHLEQADTANAVKQIDDMNRFSKNYEGITEYHQAYLNNFLAFKYIDQRKEDSASIYLAKAKEIAEKTGIPDLQTRSFFMGIAFANRFKKQLENPEQVEKFYNELSQSEGHNLQNLYELAYALYDYNKTKGDFKKANSYAEFMIKDSFKQSSDRVKNQLFELETKYETERKEKTILEQDQKIQNKNKTILFLLFGTVLLILTFVILFVLIRNKSIIKEKKLTENYASQLLQKTENERKRIASDLHDSVSNELVNLRHFIETKDSSLKTKIDFILEEVRNISRNISPTLFDKIGLKLSVEQLTERIQNQHHFFISSEIDYKGGLDSDKELQLYRIIQEGITNILKHADAVAGKVTIQETDSSVNVEIRDNGKGFDVEKMLEKGNYFGLLNITERVKYINGTVDFQSNSSGTIINIKVKKD